MAHGAQNLIGTAFMTGRRADIYLDHNSTTPVLGEVLQVMERAFRDSFANPGSRHSAGRRARRLLEDSRESLAAILGALPEEVIFTSGGTESANLAIRGLVGTGRGTIALTGGEHPATSQTCRALADAGWRLHELAIDSQGRLRGDQYANLPWDTLRLACVILAHNETGVVQNLGPLAENCAGHDVPLFVDAVQAVGKIPVNFHQLGATALSLGAHKFHGSRGVGALLVRKGAAFTPTSFGGHQEAGKRPGTEAVPLIAGMARALELWHADQVSRTERLTLLRDRLQQGLRDRCAPVVVNADEAPRLPNTLSIAFPGLDGEALLVALDLEGIACSLGSACASGSAEPAPVLVAMGCAPEVVRASVRFSVGIENTVAEIDEAIATIATVVERLRQRSPVAAR